MAQVNMSLTLYASMLGFMRYIPQVPQDRQKSVEAFRWSFVFVGHSFTDACDSDKV